MVEECSDAAHIPLEMTRRDAALGLVSILV